MLRSLELTNWKSFGETRNVVPFAPLTFLVGPNGSGKSNVLDALRFLQGIAFDYPIADVLRGRWEGQREVWLPIRGQIAEAARFSQQEFCIKTQWKLNGHKSLSSSHAHSIWIQTDGDPSVTRESLMSLPDAAYYFDTHASSLGGKKGPVAGGAISAAFMKPGRTGRGRAPSTTLSSQRSLLWQVQRLKGMTEKVDDGVVDGCEALTTKLRFAFFLDIQTNTMRTYKPEGATAIGMTGENISPLLLSRAAQSDNNNDIIAWLEELCAPHIEDIEFDRTQLREVMFYLVEQNGAKVSARSTSDGTLRFLGIITALLTAPKGSLIIMEEPDVGLHPSRIHLLVELLEEVTKKRGVQVIATTHSPTLLAHLSDAALANVVALGRDHENGISVSARLGDLPHFEVLKNSPRLDHLISTGWIERAL